MRYKYNIDQDLGIEYRDCGKWRSYQLTAQGNTIEELIESATISEVDQDGGEITCYDIGEGSEACEVAEALLRKVAA